MHCFRLSLNWSTANRVLRLYLTKMSMDTNMDKKTATVASIHLSQKSLGYFLLGKIAEKQKLTKQSIQFYQLAERQLIDHQNDDAFLLIKLEINFRITATIYKYATHTNDDDQHVIDKHVLAFMLIVLKRNRQSIFNVTELAMRRVGASNQEDAPMVNTNTSFETIDENANQIHISDTDLVRGDYILNDSLNCMLNNFFFQ